MQPIHWFPGHMAKARRQIEETLRSIDVILEILDARLPLASSNPMLADITGNKPKVIVLTRGDLANERITKDWIAYFRTLGRETVLVDARTGTGISAIGPALERAAAKKFSRQQARGIRPGPVRSMVIGIPNVGKSSVINRLAGRAATKIGDRPGITKSQQWIRLGKVQLLDTPGVLWPKLENQEEAFWLAISGAIKADIVDSQMLAAYLVSWFSRHQPDAIPSRFGISLQPLDWKGPEEAWAEVEDVLSDIARRRGLMLSGGRPNVERAAELLVRETQTGKLGRITFEHPPGSP